MKIGFITDHKPKRKEIVKVDIELAKIVFSICKDGTVQDMTPDKIELDYRNNSRRMLRDIEMLHKAGFSSVPHGDTLTVMSPTS